MGDTEENDPKEEKRQMLIKLCDDGASPVGKWSNRDSSSAHRQLGECRGLLASGCEFMANPDARNQHWDVTIWFPGFNYFEYGPDELPDGGLEYETYYIPTRERLDRNIGEDWY